MLSDTYFQIFGIVSIILMWVAIGFILLTTERRLAKSVSHHAAVKKSGHVVFSVIMSASLVFMGIFMYGWLIPWYGLSGIFAVVVGVAIFLECITTWIPLTIGWRHTVHLFCSYGAAFLLPVLILLMMQSPGLGTISMGICVGSLVVMVFLLYLFSFVKPVRRHYLVYQNIYVLAFHVSIVSMICNI